MNDDEMTNLNLVLDSTKQSAQQFCDDDDDEQKKLERRKKTELKKERKSEERQTEEIKKERGNSCCFPKNDAMELLVRPLLQSRDSELYAKFVKHQKAKKKQNKKAPYHLILPLPHFQNFYLSLN